MADSRDHNEPNDRGMLVTPMMQLQSLREEHKTLANNHAKVREELTMMLTAECKRMEAECRDMTAMMHALRDRQSAPDVPTSPDYNGHPAPGRY